MLVVNEVILSVIAGKTGTKADEDVLRTAMTMKTTTAPERVRARYRVIAGAVIVLARKGGNTVITIDTDATGGDTVVAGNRRGDTEGVRTVNRSRQVAAQGVGVAAGAEAEVGHRLSQVRSQTKAEVIVTAAVEVITVPNTTNRNKVFMNRKVIIIYI